MLLLAAAGSYAGGEQVWTGFIQSGDTEKALAAFEQAVKENPQDHLAHAGLAMLIPSRSSENRDVLAAWLEALYAGRSQPEAVLYQFQAMQCLSNRADYQQALDGFDRVLAESGIPEHLRAMLLYGRSLLLNRLGRWDEAVQSRSPLGLVTRFWLCGPFDNAEEGGHNRVFGPEQNLDIEGTYEGRRRSVSWRPLPLEPADGYIDLHALLDPSNESTAYLLTVLESKETQRCKFYIGHAGAMKVWLNGEMLADVDRYHNVIPDQVNVEGRLQAGSNTLMLKVSSGKTGKFGVTLRTAPEKENAIAVPALSALPQIPDATAHTPRPASEEAPTAANYEPLSLQLLKAIGEAAGGYPHRPLFYALLLDRWQVADENDTSVNTLLSQLSGLFPQCALLWRLRGDSEKQDNRKRLGYSFALDKDPADQAAFMKLVEYYARAPYATEGLDRIRGWKKKNELPSAVLFEQARILNAKGLKEAAFDLLRDCTAENQSARERMFLYSLQSSRQTDAQKRETLEAIIRDYPGDTGAIHELFPILLRQGDEAAVAALLEHQKRINPFFVSGYVDWARHRQARGDFEGSLKILETVKQICPDHFEAHRLSALAYRQMDDTENALQAIQAALTTRPSDPWCLEYLDFLQPDVETYASPYLVDWKTIEEPADLDLSKANYLVLLRQRIVKVHPNGNASETVREAIKILTETGVRYQQTRGVYYEGGDEEVRIVRARVWKPDGTFYDAPAPQRRSASSAADADQRLYGDYNVAILQFKGLEKGSVLELEYEKKDRGENIYAEYFGDLFYIGDNYLEPSVRTDYVLIAPKSREFYWKFTEPHYPASVAAPPLNDRMAPQTRESGTNRVWSWTFEKLPTIPREPLMPEAAEILPYIKVSTFQNWADMTQWYWNLSRDQLIPGAAVRDRLARILADYRKKYDIPATRELSDWDKVRAVNSFVNTDVRYLGLEFGIHGYKPHKVDDICNAQYGDCKDKAALAVVLLKELGIDAHMVILRTTDIGEIDYELPSLGIFNHAIYYLPNLEGKEYWIDGTATFFDAAELPSADAGANSLIVKPGGDYEFKRIPHSKPEENGAVFSTSLTLDANGTAKGYRASEFRGLYNPVVRQTYENAVKAKEIVDRTLTGTYPGAQSSNIELSDLKDYSNAERLAYEMAIPQFGVKQGNRWVLPSTLFKEAMSQRYAVLSQREYDLILNYPWSRTSILTIELPGEPKNAELPKDFETQTEFGDYSRKTEWSGNKVTVKETLVFKPVRVAKEKYAKFREFCRLIDHYQDEKISFTE